MHRSKIQYRCIPTLTNKNIEISADREKEELFISNSGEKPDVTGKKKA